MFLSDKLVILLHSSYTATVLLVNNINMLNIYIFHTKIHYEGDCLANVRRIEKGWFFFTLKTAVLLHLSSYCISNSGTATLVNNKNIRRNNYLTLHKSVRSSPDMYGEDTGLFLYKYFMFFCIICIRVLYHTRITKRKLDAIITYFLLHIQI